MQGDCLEVMQSMGTNSVDLVFGSPPYEDARTYGVGFKLKGEAWVEWAADRYVECCRVSRGLVAWVVAGRTRKFEWSATPAMLMVELQRCGVKLRNPPIYQRVGIPGSGGPDWLRSDYEWVVCAAPGRLPWSDNVACGHEPKYPAGGEPSHHSRDGRVNMPRMQREGDTRRVRTYSPPVKSNPGNIIRCHGGGGHMGHQLAHDNEAPFPLKLAEFFVRTFCPPGGIVLDPFMGSGTTAHAAEIHQRQWVGIDVRESQIDLARRRVEEVSS